MHQDLAPSPEGKNVSMGAFVRDVFLEQVVPCWQACIWPCRPALCRLCPEHAMTRLDCFPAATNSLMSAQPAAPHLLPLLNVKGVLDTLGVQHRLRRQRSRPRCLSRADVALPAACGRLR